MEMSLWELLALICTGWPNLINLLRATAYLLLDPCSGRHATISCKAILVSLCSVDGCEPYLVSVAVQCSSTDPSSFTIEKFSQELENVEESVMHTNTSFVAHC